MYERMTILVMWKQCNWFKFNLVCNHIDLKLNFQKRNSSRMKKRIYYLKRKEHLLCNITERIGQTTTRWLFWVQAAQNRVDRAFSGMLFFFVITPVHFGHFGTLAINPTYWKINQKPCDQPTQKIYFFLSNTYYVLITVLQLFFKFGNYATKLKKKYLVYMSTIYMSIFLRYNNHL
jgi:hypothetical protein